MAISETLSVTLPADNKLIQTVLANWMLREQNLATLDEAIARGFADVEAGRVQSLETARQEIRRRLQ